MAVDLTGSLIQPVDSKTGSVIDTTKKTKETGSNSGMDKDAFLQLLVAEMKYQDPLEPTSNTEYVAQFAQFSQVESLQNMADNMDLTRAQGLVGQTVVLASENAQGETEYITGVVDSVTFDNGTPYLHVDGKSYTMDELEEVVNPAYLEAQEKIAELEEGLEKLPMMEYLSASDHDTLQTLLDLYNGMNAYQQGFVSSDTEQALKDYAAQMTTILENLQKALDEAEAKIKEETEAADTAKTGEAVSGTKEREDASSIEDKTGAVADLLTEDAEETGDFGAAAEEEESVSSIPEEAI